MKTLGFSFFISTTFCFREFPYAVSGQASPTVCVDAPLAWQRTCYVFRGHLWSEASRLLIGCPTTLILRDAVRLPDLLCGIVDQALSAGHMPRNIQKDAPELAPPFDAIPDVCSGQTFEFGMHPLPPSIGCTLSISPRRSGRIHWFCDLGSRPFDNCPVLLFPGLASARNEGLRQLFNARGNASRGSDLVFVFELKLRATYTVENRRSNLTPAKPFPA